jgi:polyphosphate glucokinase
MSEGPRTLAVDIGGTGLKAIVLSPDGEMLSERVRHDTPYPCTPKIMLDELAVLAATQPAYDRVSVGFPGAVRSGIVRHVTAFVRPAIGADPDPALRELWFGWNIESALAAQFGKPVRVANDADVQGCAVVAGHGLELVITLGTGVGCALFHNGVLLPHMELSHGRFGDGLSIEVGCGDHERKKVGKHAWTARVMSALDAFEEMVLPDHLFIGGGNAKRLEGDLPAGVSRTSNEAGISGGAFLWRE